MSFPWVASLRIKAMNSQMSMFQNDQIPNHRPLKPTMVLSFLKTACSLFEEQLKRCLVYEPAKYSQPVFLASSF
jgi:hypothetical protein